MTSPARGRGRRRTSPRTNRILGVIFVLAGLGIAAYDGWAVVGAIGPRTTADAHVVELIHTPGGYRTPETWTVDLAWDGGTGSIDSRALYDALYPLEGQPPVTAERSTITGDIQRVELGGQWYVAPRSSVPIDLAGMAFGLLVAGFFAYFVVRVVPRAGKAELSPRALLVAPVLIGAVAILVGVGLVAAGVQGLLVNFGPCTTANADVVAAKYNYVDVVVDGTTNRVISSDLELAVEINLGLNTIFSHTDPVIVAVERSSADGSIEKVTYDGQSYNVGPGLPSSLVPLILGLLDLGFVAFVVISSRRATRVAAVRTVADAVPAASPNAAPGLASAPATAAPPPAVDLAAYGRIADRIEAELRRLGWWRATPPAEPVAGPFGEANATFTQWLEFVLCPRLREVAAGTALAPRTSNVSGKAVREFDGQPEADALIQVLSDLDHLMEG